MKNWRSFLSEAIAGRPISRQLTRLVMLSLRSLITGQDENIMNLSPGLKIESNVLRNMLKDRPFIRYWIGKQDGEGSDKTFLPNGILQDSSLKKEFEKYPSIPDNFNILVQVIREQSPRRLGDKKWEVGASASEDADSITINIKFNIAYIRSPQDMMKNLNELLPEVDQFMHHEFTHIMQMLGLIKGRGINVSKDMGRDFDKMIDNFKNSLSQGITPDIPIFAQYMSLPHETEAIARGLYVTSVANKIAWEDVIDELFDSIARGIRSEGEFFGIPVAERGKARQDLETMVKPILIDYAKKNLPCAIMSDGTPVSEKCQNPMKIKKITPKEQKQIQSMWGGDKGISQSISSPEKPKKQQTWSGQSSRGVQGTGILSGFTFNKKD